MSTAPRQTEAQRLAERLDPDLPTILRIDAEHAGAELLRQDELLEQALEAMELNCSSHTEGKAKDAITAIRAHREAK